jgi:hypothetical protein
VYVFDRRQHHHLSELTPSYERRFVGSQWEEAGAEDGIPVTPLDPRSIYESLSEEIDDYIREGDRYTEDWSYVHVADVERRLTTIIEPGFFPPAGKQAGAYPIQVVSVTTQDAIEEILEGRCNGDL